MSLPPRQAAEPEPPAHPSDRTIAIILGASQFLEHPSLTGGEAFSASAQGVRENLVRNYGQDWGTTHLLDLFDSTDPVADQVERIAQFCQTHSHARRLLLFYVGHGGFLRNRRYYLALARTKPKLEATTGLLIGTLADVVDGHFPGRQVVLILDCCFAGEAVPVFMADDAITPQVAHQTLDAFPGHGTSLLCASSKDEPAISAGGAGRTMFSECLVDVLRDGIPGAAEWLTLQDIHKAVASLVSERHGLRAVHPELHSPRQRGVNVALEPWFQNPAWTPPPPKTLPEPIRESLDSPLASVRSGALDALWQLLESPDLEMQDLARSTLEDCRDHDDSLSVRKRAAQALQGKPRTSPAQKDGFARGEDENRPQQPPTPDTDLPHPPRYPRPPRPAWHLAAAGAALALAVAALGWIAPNLWGPDTREQASALVARAKEALDRGRLTADPKNSAWALFERALEHDPDHTAAHEGLDEIRRTLLERARTEHAQGRLQKAQALTDQLLAVDPANADARELNASVGSAIEQAQQRLSNIDQHLHSARQAREANDLIVPFQSSAWRHYSRVLELDPDNTEALQGLEEVRDWHLARARRALEAGDTSRADDLISRLTDVEPDNAAAAALRDRLADVREAAKPFRDELALPGQGPLMKRIFGGPFAMGSPDSEAGRHTDEALHQASVGDFAIGVYEVTRGEFRRFVQSEGYQTYAERDHGCTAGVRIHNKTLPPREGSWRQPGFPDFQQADNHPVVCITWRDAVAYAEWLSAQTGETYRLPTEAQWEYAARAGTDTARFWSPDPSKACAYANVRDRFASQHFDWPWVPAHQCMDGVAYTAAVNAPQYQPNPHGLYHMLGNVSEWTCSRYVVDYPKDGPGAESRCAAYDSPEPRAIRGGAWINTAARVRSAARLGAAPTHRDYLTGFRLAREVQ